MLQPEEIKAITFEQSVFSGYKKEDVDAFLDKLYREYSRLYTENAELVEKLKVCISEIQDYRQNEKFLNAAILNAQKLNETAMQEIALKKQETELATRKQADEILNKARAEAKLLTDTSNQKIADVRERSIKEFAEKQKDNNRFLKEQMDKIEADIASKEAEYDALCSKVEAFRTMALNLFTQQIDVLNMLPVYEGVAKSEQPQISIPEVEEKELPDVADQTDLIQNIEEQESTEETTVEVVSADMDSKDTLAEAEDVKDDKHDTTEDLTGIAEVEKCEELEIEVKETIDEIVADLPKEANVEAIGFSEEPIIVEPNEEQISIDEILNSTSPVEPSSPVLTISDSEEEKQVIEEEKLLEDEFHLFGTTPLIFPQDIPEEDEDEELYQSVAAQEKGGKSRFKKKLKFGVDFDVKKDK